MKKIFSAFTLAVMLALFLCFPVSAIQPRGVIYDETNSLGSPTLTYQGEDMLPQLSVSLGIDIRVDVLSETSDDDICETAAWLYSKYGYGYGQNMEGITLTIQMNKLDDHIYAKPAENGWCVYANLREDRGSSQELVDVLYAAVEPYMADEAWNGEDMTMSATALTQAVDAMAEAATDYILTNCPPEYAAENIDTAEENTADQNSVEMKYVFDVSDLLSFEQWEELESRAETISKRQNCGIYFALVDDFTDYGYGDIYEVTYTIYHDNELGMGENRDGIIVMLSMEERDYAMFVYGEYAEYAFNEYGQLMLEEAFLDDFGNNDWYSGISHYLDTCDEFLTKAEEGKPVRESPLPSIAIATGASCLIAAIVCSVFKYRMRTVHQQTEANAYITEGGLQLTDQYDQYTHTTETRTKIEKESSSGTSSESGGGGSGRSGNF
ncbi:TPM domain-containing protein [Anaerotignum lactatifermentans]|uniref:TPM domain-containing protein n=1 Tax=Anaerotignum lactatifermentans TaxID=160404 RepID=A0ABS2GE77_9FIRM|nr:TPM domain-containing protein [Anaerotignum lactatifermentans]MBM6830404.1 TPM domain-containing protein [Anaerotignum lactatifermentans]MBM6878922.1 TPM domain-containing protein [Anaerotignum lactatifermentans]MBM6951966.1 TPM domain-containing protein [Anaerotignum lactatifermentans]